jgi:hypothetical protein
MIALLLALLSMFSGAGSHGAQSATRASVAPLSHLQANPRPLTGHPLAG